MRRFVVAAGLIGLLGAGLWTTRTPEPLPTLPNPKGPDQSAANPAAELPVAAAKPTPSEPVSVPAVPPPVVVDAQKIAARPPVAGRKDVAAPIAPLPLPARTPAAPPTNLAEASPAPATPSYAASQANQLPSPQSPAAHAGRTIVPPKNGDIPGQPASSSASRLPPLATPTATRTAAQVPVQGAPSQAVASKPRLQQVAARTPKPAKRVATRKPVKTAAVTRPTRQILPRSVLRGFTVPPLNSVAAMIAPMPRLSPAPRMAPAARVLHNPS